MEELRRRAPDSADYAQLLAGSYARLADLALQTGDAPGALLRYGQLFALLDDFERRIPGFRLDPSAPNEAIRADFLTRIRSTALALYRAGDYATAEQALRMLVDRRYEPCSTQCHLARLYLLTGREKEAKVAVEQAWAEREGAPEYMPPRVLFFRTLFAMVAGRPFDEPLRAMKPLLADPEAHGEWTIAPVIDHSADRLRPEDLALLRALSDGIDDTTKMDALEGFAPWRRATS